MNTPDNILEKKRSILLEAISRRNSIPAEERTRRSAIVCQRISETLDEVLSTHRQPLIAVYAAMNSEVDLKDFIQYAYKRGARIAFPCMTKAERDDSSRNTSNGLYADKTCRPLMLMRLVSFESHLRGNVPFIKNPIKTLLENDHSLRPFPIVDPEDVDMAIIPMVAFDSSFMRLGYGGGNYDSFLSRTRDDAVVVGVAFEEQRVPLVPAEKHDLRLPLIESA